MRSVKINFLLKWTFFVSVVFCFSCSDKSIDKNITSDKSEFIIELPIDTTTQAKFDIEMMLGCGGGALTSIEFKDFKKLIDKKNYKELKNYLDSSGLKQLLSVITLDDLYERKMVKLTEREQEIIANIKSSSKTYSACEGCGADGFSGKIADMFANKPKGADFSNVLYNIKFHMGLVKPVDS